MRHILLAALCFLFSLAATAQESFVLNSHALSAHIQAEINAPSCGEANGEIILNAVSTHKLAYSLDGELFQYENVLSELAAGDYTIYCMDADQRLDSLTVRMSDQEALDITDVSVMPTTCGEESGKLLLEVSGGRQPVSYTLNHQYPQREEYFSNLSAGEYHIRITDANGCSLDTIATVAQTGCPVYIPNIFSPNGDGVNDYFRIQTADENNVMITRFLIFDRWGSKVYEKYDLPIHSNEGWWDGTYKRFTMNKGHFAYFVEVEFENGMKETFRGTITLLK